MAVEVLQMENELPIKKCIIRIHNPQLLSGCLLLRPSSLVRPPFAYLPAANRYYTNAHPQPPTYYGKVNSATLLRF